MICLICHLEVPEGRETLHEEWHAGMTLSIVLLERKLDELEVVDVEVA